MVLAITRAFALGLGGPRMQHGISQLAEVRGGERKAARQPFEGMVYFVP